MFIDAIIYAAVTVGLTLSIVAAIVNYLDAA